MLNRIKSIFKNKEEDQINLLRQKFIEEKFDIVISQAEEYVNSSSPKIAKEACKLIGLSYFRKEEYIKATSYFLTAVKYKAEANDWFNIMTSAILSKDIKTGKNAFETALELSSKPTKEEELTIPQIRQYYACALRDVEEYEEALCQINELRTIYETYKITDDTFLYLRGVPFLSHTMEVAIDIFNGLGSEFDSVKWINDFSKKLDEDGQKYLSDIKKRLK